MRTLASDHAAIELKSELVSGLTDLKSRKIILDALRLVSIIRTIYKLASTVDKVSSKKIALCGSGIGISIIVNRNPKVRCALVSGLVSCFGSGT